MRKKITDTRIAQLLKHVFNLRKWSDYDRVKSFTLYLWEGFKKLFIPQTLPAVEESFDEAVKKYQLDKKKLQSKKTALLRLSMVMLIFFVGMLGYTVYQLFYGSFSAALLSSVVALLALVLAFRYHFWYFQIKQHKLGCTFNEWFHKGLLGKRHE